MLKNLFGLVFRRRRTSLARVSIWTVFFFSFFWVAVLRENLISAAAAAFDATKLFFRWNKKTSKIGVFLHRRRWWWAFLESNAGGIQTKEPSHAQVKTWHTHTHAHPHMSTHTYTRTLTLTNTRTRTRTHAPDGGSFNSFNAAYENSIEKKHQLALLGIHKSEAMSNVGSLFCSISNCI